MAVQRPSLKELIAEEERREAAAVSPPVMEDNSALPNVPAAVKMLVAEVEPKRKSNVGRPKIKPPSKLTSFHLSLELIAQIEAAATETNGNKSLFLTQVLTQFFSDNYK